MTPETDQEKLLIAGAAVSGSLIQFNYIKEKLKLGKSILVFVTGIICGIYGGAYIASIIPGCSRELMLLLILGTSFTGRTLLGATLTVIEKRAPLFIEHRIDDIEERLHPDKDEREKEPSGDKEEEDND